MADVNIGALVAIIVFYIILLAIGTYAARKRGEGVEEMMLAGRNLGWFLGVCTMTATWTGGGFLNGTAEAVYDPNQGALFAFTVWAAPFSMLINGVFFCKKMRSSNYVTMLDPFQEKYGSRMTGLLFIVTAISEMFWAAAIFYALGTTFSVVVGLDRVPAVLVSAAVTIVYSMMGGLYSVAYTDVIQLAFMFIGVWLSLPFVVTNPAVGSITENSDRWTGKWGNQFAGVWAEFTLMGILGSVPWQEYYQRVLACKTLKEARILTFGGAFFCSALFALPSMFLGAAGAMTDWTKTDFYQPGSNGTNGTVPEFGNSLILPLVLQYLTPSVVSFIGLGAIAAAVMSSADSILIASSSLFAHNVYKLLFRPKASDREIIWVMRIALLIIGACAAVLALVVQSVIYLFYLCVDLVYVILFPQLCAVIYFNSANTYGALTGYIVGMILRLLGGDPSLNIKPVIEYPFYSPELGQLFPFRTLAMLAGLICIIAVSKLTEVLFKKNILSPKFDVFRCFRDKHEIKESLYKDSDVKKASFTMAESSQNDNHVENGAVNNGVSNDAFKDNYLYITYL